MADVKKAGLAFAKAFKQAEGEANAALAAARQSEAITKSERMAALAETERALPLRLARATPKTKQEIAAHADRVGRQMMGEHVTSGKKGDTKNLAGRSMKENQRIKELEYELEATKNLPPSVAYEPRIGDVNVAFPGDYTVSDVNLKTLQGVPIGSKQEGGSRYGLGKLDMEDPLFWASNEGPAQLAQDKITDVAHIFEPERVLAHHLAMGPTATNFAQHFADANLRAIDYSKLSKKDMDTFDRIIAGGYDVKNQKTGKTESVTFPHWPGIADPEAAYAAMKADPELRKWFNSRMKTPKVTEATNMPNGLDVQWAITHPELRNMEVNLTGHSVGEVVPGAQLTGTADHQTYSKGIRGKYLGHQKELTPFVLSFPDAAQHIASTKRPQDFTGTIQKIFPHQVVDQQYIDELGEYDRQLRKMILGKKKGGAVTKVTASRDKDYEGAYHDAMATEINKANGGVIKSLQWKAEGGAINPMPWKAAGGGWAKAGKAIQKAAKEAGMAKPQTAEKDLTTLQDFHTSLGDSVRARAMEAQKQMEGFDYKYDKGQRVFTKDSAAKNKPPYTILHRTRVGNQPMREDMNDLMSKKIIDPETGKTKRTPYEPGYRVRYEKGDEWSEFDIPASAVMGDVEMAGGGMAKAMKAVQKASKMADEAVAAKKVEAPTIIIPSKISNLKEAIRQSKGEYGAKRVERAADEIKNLERLYKEQALREAFGGDNAKALMTMNPKDFEKYSAPLDARFTDEASTRHTPSGERMSFREYIEDYLPSVGGFNDVPFLQINKQEQGLPLVPFISGHEGRHRNRVLSSKGEKSGLVQLLPRAELREPFPRRHQEEYIEALRKELEMTGNKVLPEKYTEPGESVFDRQVQRPEIILPDVYAQGGAIKSLPWKAAQGGMVPNLNIDNTMPDSSDSGMMNYVPRFDDGGAVDQGELGGDGLTKAKLMTEILARMAKEQGREEMSSLKKPRAATDLINRGMIAPLAGAPVDLINMGLEGVDAVRDLASGKRVGNRLASEKPFLGSEHLKDLMSKYGMTTEEDRPMMELGLSILSPTGAVKSAAKAAEAAPKAVRAGRSGLNAVMARR